MVATGDVLHQRYRLEQPIGRGGFARVYLATDSTLSRQVAVKILLPDFMSDASFVARFEAEAKRAASLAHPNILPVHDYGHEEDAAYLVMPYVAGGTLQDRLYAAGQLSLHEASAYLDQAAAALDYAHKEHHIVHRDVKPVNMLLSKEGHLFLADFGIAKVVQETQGASSSQVIGTLPYMAPEVFRGIIGPMCDIYALGCVLFELLTGKPPYVGINPQVMYGHMSEPIPSLAGRLGRETLPGLQAVVDRALAKDPAARYPSAGALAEAVREIIAGRTRQVTTPLSTAGGAGGLPATEVTPTNPLPPQRAAHPVRTGRRRLVGVIGAVLGVVLLGLALNAFRAAANRGTATVTALSIGAVLGGGIPTATVAPAPTMTATPPPTSSVVPPTATLVPTPIPTATPTFTPSAVPTATIPVTPTPRPNPPTATTVQLTATPSRTIVAPSPTPGGVVDLTGQVPSEVPGLAVVAPMAVMSALDVRTKPRDVYAIDLAAGQTLLVTVLNQSGNGTAYASVVRPGASTVESSPLTVCNSYNGCADVPFVPAVSGKYYVVLQVDKDVMRYRLTLAISGRAATPVVDNPVTGSVNLTGQVPSEVPGLAVVAPVTIASVLDARAKVRDVYAVDLVAGQPLLVTASSDSGASVRTATDSRAFVLVSVVRPGASTVESSPLTVCNSYNGCADVPFVPTVSGKYYLVLNINGVVVPYRLTLAIRGQAVIPLYASTRPSSPPECQIPLAKEAALLFRFLQARLRRIIVSTFAECHQDQPASTAVDYSHQERMRGKGLPPEGRAS